MMNFTGDKLEQLKNLHRLRKIKRITPGISRVLISNAPDYSTLMHFTVKIRCEFITACTLLRGQILIGVKNT